MNGKTLRAPSNHRWSNILILVSVVLVGLDLLRLWVLPQAYQITFMDGFETAVALLCVAACGRAALRSSPVGKGLWIVAAVFFFFMAGADFHDFLTDLAQGPIPLNSFIEVLGWSHYPVLALLIFFPLEKDGRPDWTWLSYLDFLLVVVATAMAYFCLIYLPHALAGEPWMVRGQAELVRNILLSGGLLLRAGLDPASEARAFFRRMGGIFAGVTLLQGLFPGYVDPISAIGRPALFLVLSVLAARWEYIPEDHTDQGGRRAALRLVLSLLAATTLLVVVILTLSAPAPYHGLMYVIVGVSAFLFILRSTLAERSRNAAETKLRNSELDYRVLFESAVVPIVIFEPESERIVQANAAACEMYGVATEGLVGASLKEFTRDVALGEAHVAELLRTGKSQRFDSIHRTREGRDIDVVVSASVIQYRGKKAILSFNRDVTERKQAEEARRKSESRFQTLIENAPAAIGISRNGVTIYGNHKYLEMYGFGSVEEIVGRPIGELWAPDCREMIEERARQRSLGMPAPARYEATGLRKDGSQFPVELEVTIVDLPDGPATLAFLSDITERNQAVERIQASEEKFRKAFMTGADAFYIATLYEGKILEVNDSFQDVFGYTREEVIGKTSLQLGLYAHPPDRKAMVARMEADGHIRNLKLRGRKKGGQLITIFLSVNLIQGADEKLILGVVKDITDLTEAEEALREGQEKYRVLYESSRDAILMLSPPTWNFTVVNPTAIELFGARDASEFMAVNLGNVSPEHQPDGELSSVKSGKMIEMALERGSHFFEWTHKKFTGEEFIAMVDLTRMTYRGQPQLQATVRDITQEKRAQETLIQLRQAVDTSSEVMFMTGREGVITFINPEFTRLYGYSQEETVGKTTPRILKSGAMQPEAYARFWNTIRNKQVARGEVVNKAKDGHLVSVESSVNPVLDEHGNIAGFLAIQKDVTGRKQLEEQFRQAQKMEAVGRLAGGVAHDFNNLLTVINGYAQMLIDRPDLKDPVRDQLAQIFQSGERAAALTRQLLAFSRKQVLAPRILDLSSVVENMEKMLRRLVGEDIKVNTNPGQNLGQIKADAAQIEQVVMNLVVNARDAMPSGGSIFIETRNADLDEAYARTHLDVTPGRYVMLAVSDTGSGMDTGTLAHIFEPFYTTKGPGKGTGLGLSTVYGIVKQTGGHVGVYSEVGKGTTFTIYLPRIDQVMSAVAEQGGEIKLTGSETILVAEDESGVRSLIDNVLASHGYAVLSASTPAEAAALSSNHAGQIHLLLTDVIMPGYSGKQLADQLSFMRREMKVLFISGYTADAIAQHGVLDDNTQFLHKPFTPTSLLRKIRETLDMQY